MIHVFYGNNEKDVKNKYDAKLASLMKKNSSIDVFRFDDENFKEEKLEELISGQDLFQKNYIIVLYKCFSNGSAKDFILSHLNDMSESKHNILIIEDKLTKEITKKLEKKAETIEVFDKLEKKAERGFSPFALADALGRRDKKSAWVSLERIRRSNIPNEELHGIIFWQFKNITLAKKYGTKIPGVNPYPASKAETFAKKFTDEELSEKLSDIVSMYHNAHAGEVDFDLAIEKFVLEI